MVKMNKRSKHLIGLAILAISFEMSAVLISCILFGPKGGYGSMVGIAAALAYIIAGGVFEKRIGIENGS